MAVTDHLRTELPRRGPLGVALLVVIAALMVLDGSITADARGVSPEGLAAIALMVVPLLWVHEAPFAVFAIVTAGLAANLATIKSYNTVVLPELVVCYALVRHGDRRRALWLAAAAVVIIGLSVGLTSHGDGPFRQVFFLNVMITLFVILLADAVRSRAELRAAAAERERRLVAEQAAQGEQRLSEERLRIAREVHDVVAHAMVAINVQAGVAEYLHAEDPGAVPPALREIKRVSGEALGDLRSTLGLLRGEEAGAPVEPTAGLAQLELLVAPLQAAGIAVHAEVQDMQAPTAVATTARRIVQEALTNVLRHAGAAQVNLRVARQGERLLVEVRDDGAALVPAGASLPAGSGNGVRGMRERAEAVGGTLRAGRDPDGPGWVVRADLPLA